jgi:glyceraldehyde 3-phosphate dehydrogenase
MIKFGINGLGRIGRATLKILMEQNGEFELVAVNDLVSADELAYVLQYDSIYGKYEKNVSADDDHLVIDGKRIRILQEKDPSNLPWDDLGVDTVFECTGIFRDKEGMEKHLKGGAKRVILSAPSKSEEVETVVHGVNNSEQQIISCASCTTNCITPVVEILGRRIGIEKAVMTTTHAYTSSQPIVDMPQKKKRRGRAGGINIVPTTTGAATATIKVLPQFEKKFDGIALRVPVPVGSVADMVFVTTKQTSAEEINEIFKEEAGSDRYRGIVAASDDPLVSTDIIKNPHASIVDLGMTMVIDGNLVKILSWYDNEWGYASQMVKQAIEIPVKQPV